MSSHATLMMREARQRNRTTIILLLVVSFISLLIVEQLFTGWLALGNRINISRRDFNILEIVVMLLGLAWGLFALWVAVRLQGSGGQSRSVTAYFQHENSMPPGLQFATAFLVFIGVVCLLIAAQVVTGWIPMGERVNISRRDLSFLEWAVIILGFIWGGLCLRTALGFLRREQPAWSWGQWVLFICMLAGGILMLSGIFDLPDRLGPDTAILADFATVLELIAPGLLLILSALAAYRYLSEEYGDTTAQKEIVGTLAERARARDIRSARVSAGQTIRNGLAQSPSAGAIVGSLALFIFFSVATDLFLIPTSLAGALTNNVTRGIVAIGVTMLMISGEFDLSVGSMLGIAGLTFLGLMTGQFPPGGPQLHPVIAAILTLAFMGFLGLINGFILIRTGIPSFIVTLATLLMFRGIPLVFIAGGRNLRYIDYFNEAPFINISRILITVAAVLMAILVLFMARSILARRLNGFRQRLTNYPSDPSDFRTLGVAASALYLAASTLVTLAIVIVLLGSVADQIGQLSSGSSFLRISFFDLTNGRIASLPIIGEIPREINLRIGVFWWLVLVMGFQFVLNDTRYGNATFATGGNPGAALAQGINVSRVKVTNFILVAVLVGIAGILDASRLQSIDALRGTGLELEVIAATVIGGALLTGGYGSVIGALLGVFMFGMMQTGLVLIGVDARLFNAFIGAIILVAVIINSWSRRIKT